MISGESTINKADLTIKITDFEGPLDLLLHLIKKHEMDILALPIAQVTEQYLSFIKDQQAMQLDVAAEYLVMAAKLIRLKSNDLLPQPEVEEDQTDEEGLDPKQELINRLLVYQRFQQAATFFDERQEVGMQSFGRPALADETPEEERQLTLAPGLSLVDLQLAFNNVLARQRDLVPRTRQVRSESFTIGDGIKTIEAKLQTLPKTASMTFTELFDGLYDVDHLVMTFLGLLEMSKEKKLTIWQADLSDEILIKAVNDERD
ncbi:segregation and condensation protein A [Fructobacillus papyrifericola]|uniref:segregation and condensation protein A n=1 Tax=Fructobacillus papyrifericola TaxID=2713172 RepID=UPI001EE602A0|nr:segregation/condensation protein A [Fructobacillus papyrifericola]